MIPIEAYIITAAIIGASIGFLGAALMAASRNRGLYNRGWNAGREFAAKNIHDTLSR